MQAMGLIDKKEVKIPYEMLRQNEYEFGGMDTPVSQLLLERFPKIGGSITVLFI